jgi:hypothetical protein
MAKKLMVAVPATQPGATFGTHDRERFDREVVTPVKEFLLKTGGACPVLLFFFGGNGPEHEEMQPDNDRREEGLPPHNKTPSFSAARDCFQEERAKGLVHELVLGGMSTYLIEHYMRNQGAEDLRILSIGRLGELVAEVTVVA